MKEKLIVALDVDSLESVEKLLNELYPTVGIFKIGYQSFLKNGWEVVRLVKERGAKVFLDLKLFDIPNTVSRAVAVLAKEDVFMFNIHALGGYKMMREAAAAVHNSGKKPLILAVTLLTSFDKNTLLQVGLNANMEEGVMKLAVLSKKAGLDGVVASPREVEKIKELCGKDFFVVCPGIRPQGVSKDDQNRTSTPYEAVTKGADYIVVGRPITQAANPLRAAQEVKKEIENI